MNELLFFLHVAVVMLFGFGALRLGSPALTAWVALQAVLANLFVIKQISFFGFHVTCSDVFAVGSILGLNLLREYFGAEAAKRALWTCFFSMVFFVAMAQIHLLYTPSPYDTAHSAFEAILSPSPRLLGASLLVFFIVQQIDMRFFSYLKDKFSFLPLVVRNGISVSTTQVLDTVLFSFIGLFGLVTHLTDIILISSLIKLLVISLMSPLVHFSKRFLPRSAT
ncbi:MAG: queuosine precursor transporter [Candidatus Melainabacteria bacterium]|nr:queuosine precursor transporter [Candidatus Melainabacteria bacterium]